MMDLKIGRALKTDSLIDITTVGRRTGKPHKIEIAFHNLDGTLYISGRPGRRDWYACILKVGRIAYSTTGKRKGKPVSTLKSLNSMLRLRPLPRACFENERYLKPTCLTGRA
jgi:hypothetical protein